MNGVKANRKQFEFSTWISWGFGGLFQDFAYEIAFFCILRGGGPGTLANFPRKVQ